MANVSKINFNGETLDVKDAHAREQLLHLTADNYTADVTGDYTVNAGDISMSSANATMHTTADRTIDTNGNDSVHIDGASTLNVGGLRTETFAGDKTETVTGTMTEKFKNVNTTVTGKWMVNTPEKNFSMGDIATESEVTTAIDDLKSDLKSKDKYLVIADSYGVKSQCGDNAWPYSLVNLLGLTPDEYTIKVQGSVGFVGFGYGKFIDLLENTGIADKNSITKIVVGGGANDATASIDDIKTGVNNFIKKAKVLFPNAIVYVCVVSYIAEIKRRTLMFRQIAEGYSSANVCGGVYIPNIQNAILDTSLMSDGVHPAYNGEANTMIANAIMCGLNGTFERNITRTVVTITPNDAVSSIDDIEINKYMYNNIPKVCIQGLSSSIPNSFSVNFKTTTNVSNTVAIGTIETMFPCSGGFINMIPAYAICRTTESPLGINVPCTIIIADNTIHIHLASQSTASDFNPPINVDTINIIPLASWTTLL